MALPFFTDEYQAPYDVDQILAGLRATRPDVEVDLAELEEAVRGYRGVYEMSWPTIDGPLALKFGPSSTRWINRKPDFRQAYRPWQEWIRLYEVTPVPHPEGGFLIYSWTLRVRGEPERRRLWLLELAQQQSGRAAAHRMEVAG